MKDMTQHAVMNPQFTIEVKPADVNHDLLVFEPLEQGYGHTLGNALRRVLLTSLTGYAITSVVIEGVDHQYSVIDGVVEDVVELILNLKQIRVKSSSDLSGVLRIKASGPCEVKAGDIICEGGFEVVNKKHHIAHITGNSKLNITMRVESGSGYRLSSEAKEIGLDEIAVDAMFSPIVKVSYKIEATRVGGKTDYDRLVLDVLTDGTISPLDATRQAARILVAQLNQVFNPSVAEQPKVVDEFPRQESELMYLTVEELDLPTRIANALRKGGFQTVGDLVRADKQTIAKVKNLGGKSLDLISEALIKKGVNLEE